MKRVLLPVALLLLLFGAWEVYVDLGGADPVILPPPHDIAKSLWVDRGLLWTNFLSSAEEVLLGIVLAAAVGLVLAVVIHLSETLRRALYPLLIASQTIPFPMLAPLLVLWLGFGIAPKLVVIALVSFFPIVVTTFAALQRVDPALLKLMQSFDAPRWRTFWHVELPSALPGVVDGTKVAVVVAVIGAVFAEFAGANSGLGRLFQLSEANLLIPRAYAAVVILSLFAIALFALLTLAERRALPWAYEPRGGGPVK